MESVSVPIRNIVELVVKLRSLKIMSQISKVNLHSRSKKYIF
ncbi:hypothetical protein [Mammaliicoccus sciuri]|nr:hypothetical protein [Mammaliicoccus sciuri]